MPLILVRHQIQKDEMTRNKSISRTTVQAIRSALFSFCTGNSLGHLLFEERS